LAAFVRKRTGYESMTAFDVRRVLEAPSIYQLFQRLGGFFRLRLIALNDYLPISPGSRLFDIGCGPGHIIEHLPKNIEYHGFDTNESYIDFAARHFGHLGSFHCCMFDETIKETFGLADIVTMTALLHHLADDEVIQLLSAVRTCLRPGGIIFTLDPCFREGQSAVAKWIHAHDRGLFVRAEPEYRALLSRVFPCVETHIREDLSIIPTTHIITVSHNA
jgi:2-polyprenyl-3-methyl-5-hydroxy-6-metoxy-1,4-benzoquinol methylase